MQHRIKENSTFLKAGARGIYEHKSRLSGRHAGS